MARASISNLLGKITVLFVICCCCLPVQAKYGGGTGEPNDPYLIYTAGQMNEIGLSVNSEDWDKHFKLMADIDLSVYTGTSFNIIGNYENRFIGVFDGNGHTISNFTYTSTVTNYIGLFGYVSGENAEIKNLVLINPNVDAGTGNYVGSLVGDLREATITNCYIEGGTVSGRHYVGGLVGINWRGKITNCYSSDSVTGDEEVGGLVGNNGLFGTISKCYSSGDVLGFSTVGGLVGHNSTRITNSYSTGSVSGDRQVGGLVGINRYTITNCYSNGSVFGSWAVGGLVGTNYYGTVLGCFWDIQTSDQTTSGRGTGKTTEQMKVADTFFAWGMCGNEGVWTIDEGQDYPRLSWQNIPGVPIETYEPVYGGGSGTETDPYQIWTAEQLNTIGLIPCHWDKNFKLMVDVDLSGFMGTSFNMIGYWLNSGDNKPFSGVFDGNGYRIINFSYTSPGTCIGVFGYVRGDNAEIKDLGLIDPNIDARGGDYVGSLIGILGVGSVLNCNVEGGSISGGDVVGGLVGLNYAKITTNYSITSVFGNKYVGGLIGQNHGTITNCYSKPEVSGEGLIGGLVGSNRYGTIINCQSDGDISGIFNIGGLTGRNSHGAIANCDSSGYVLGQTRVGGLVGSSWGNITNCYSTGRVSGENEVGGLVGVKDYGTITNCYSTGNVSGNTSVGGMVGVNLGAISSCYSTGSVVGGTLVGGLVGDNRNLIRNCYSSGTVSGSSRVGGLIGIHRMKEVRNCYSMVSVTGNDDVGGLVGYYNDGSYTKCFWDNTVNSGLSGIGNTTDPNVIDESTTKMQIENTFTDAGWDFNTPIWTIDEGKYYPRLWWEFVPVLYAELEVTLGTSNRISWGPVYIAVEYYAECSEDANFTSIIYSSGWITETSFEFTGLEVGKRYWYSVKARNAAGMESQWSNVESSLQCTLSDAVEIMLDPNSLKNENMKNALLNKIDEVLEMIDGGLYEDALSKLENDILAKMNGCGEMGEPDKNDWIITCEAQAVVYPHIMETIEHVRGLMEQSL